MKNCFNRISRRAAYRETGISVDSVRQRVAQKLGDAPEEQERTRRRMKKRLVLSVVVAILLFATAAAAGDKYLSFFFQNGTPGFEKEVKAEPIVGKFDNGKWEVTINESISDANTTYLSMTLRAGTAEAAAYLADYDNWEARAFPDFKFYQEGSDTEIDFGLSGEIHCGSYKSPEDTEDFMDFWLNLHIPNPQQKAVVLRMVNLDALDSRTGFVFYPEKLTIPISSNIKSFTIEPNQKTISYSRQRKIGTIKELEQEITVRKLSFTPLGLNVDLTSNDVTLPQHSFFIEMADGTIRSFNQLLAQDEIYDCFDQESEPEKNYCFSATMREVKGLENFKSFIIGTTAYPLDGGTPYQVKIDGHLKPFTLSCVEKMVTATNTLGNTYQRPTDWYPVKELCDKLGAGYQWDEAKQCATITRCGETLTLPLGQTITVKTPGDVSPNKIQTEFINGTLYASRDLIFALRIRDRDTTDNSVKIIFP